MDQHVPGGRIVLLGATGDMGEPAAHALVVQLGAWTRRWPTSGGPGRCARNPAGTLVRDSGAGVPFPGGIAP
jgi:hypothetical protein